MNALITFLLLLSLLNDIFEFSCQDMLALTCATRSALVSTDLIFVRAVASPDTFMKSFWSFISIFCRAPTIIAVAKSVFLASIVLTCLVFRLTRKPSEEKITGFQDDVIEMKDISYINTSSKKSSRSLANVHEPLSKPATSSSSSSSPYSVYIGDFFNEDVPIVVNAMSPYAVYLGDLFSSKSQVASPYAVHLGHLFREGTQVDLSHESPYQIYLGDLFQEESQPIIPPKRRMSYADAVGYEKMEVRKPRNPVPIGYVVYLGDLFQEPEPLLLSSNTSPAPVKMSYADAVGYELMEAKYPRKLPSVYYDVYLGDLFAEPEYPKIKQEARIQYNILISLLIDLIESNIKFYCTYKLTKSILNNRFYKHSLRNSDHFITFTIPKHTINMKKLY